MESLLVNTDQRSQATQWSPNFREKQFKKNDYIFKAGERSSGLYFIQSGSAYSYVSKQKKSRTGRSQFILDILSSGDFAGHEALIFGANEIDYSLKALTDCTIRIYDKSVIVPSNENGLLAQVMKQVLNKKSVLEDRRYRQYMASVSERVADCLLLFAKQLGESVSDGILIDVNLTRKELAQIAGTIDESFTRHIKELKNLGIIDYDKKKITIKDIKELTRIVNP